MAPLFALAAALLFAAVAPSAKILLRHTDPIMLSSIMYVGSGFGLSIILFVQQLIRGRSPNPGGINKADLPWLIGVTTVGGIMAPVCLMIAMSWNTASSVSLLLNFEIVFTALIACSLFGEKLGSRVIVGLVAILIGGICLSWKTDFHVSWTLLFAIAAGLCWAIDNNLTSQIRNIAPLRIARFKGLVAGAFNLGLATCLGHHLPNATTIVLAALAGVICCGLSLYLFILAIRMLGAARATSYFATEPFMAAVLSVLILGEPINSNLVSAAIAMSLGVWLIFSEKHERMPSLAQEQNAMAIVEERIEI